jgi:glycerol-3-phosphate dehydrogenase
VNENVRERKLAACASERQDIVVIGGGITGCGVLRDAALRGIKCLLLEKGDFASGTSSKSGKLIHGGLRYLRYANFHLVYEATEERFRLLRRVAPHLVRPVRFLFPFYKGDKTPRWFVAIGLFLYMLLALRHGINRFGFKTKSGLFAEEPDLRREGSTGGLYFYDCACIDSRLVIDTLKSAVENGAAGFNYCEADKIERVDGGVKVSAINRLTGKRHIFNCRAVINAGGAWGDDILSACPDTEKLHLKSATGIHLIFKTEKLPVTHTMAMNAKRDGRSLYMVKWDDNIIVGSTDKFYEGDKDAIPVCADSIEYLLETLNWYFPELRLTKDDVHSTTVGLRPLISDDSGKSIDELPRDSKILVDPGGIVSIAGGKLTTYRAMAEQAVDEAVKNFFRSRKLSRCVTVSPISGGNLTRMKDVEKRFRSLNADTVRLMLRRYGSNAERILGYCADEPSLGGFVHPDIPCTFAEIKYFVEEEFAESLSDVMFRRTQIYLFEKDNGIPAARIIAEYIGKHKEWGDTRIENEVKQYLREIQYLLKNLK